MIDSTRPPSKDSQSNTTTLTGDAEADGQATSSNSYYKAVYDLHVQAFMQREVEQFVDALVYHLGQIASMNGAASGDILSRLGLQIKSITEWNWAQEEADRLKKEGQSQH